MPAASDPHALREVRYRIREAEERRQKAQACAREIMASTTERDRYSHLDLTIRDNRIADIVIKFL